MLTLVVAVARNGVIGAEGGLPWHLPDDLAHFKRVTLGKTVLMGRRTFESIGKPLAGRRCVVFSRDRSFAPAGVAVAREPATALAAAARAPDEQMVIGGAELYTAALPLARAILLTRVDATPEGDTFLPTLDPSEWRETLLERHPADSRHAHAYEIVRLDRR